MISLRYGTLPVVRETGGLRDTVLSYNEQNGAGNGFSFFNYNAHDMLYTLRRAVYFFHNQPDTWRLLQHRAMTGDYSWAHSAEMYLSLYKDMLRQAGLDQDAPPKAVPTEETIAEAPAEEPPVEAPAKEPTAEAPVPEKKPQPRKAKQDKDAKPAEKKPAGKKTTAKPKADPAAKPSKVPGRKKAAAKTNG